MMGLVVAILILVVLQLVVTLFLADRGQREMLEAIRRQDDRLRKRAGKQLETDDEEMIGHLVADLRDGETFLPQDTADGVAGELMRRHPGFHLAIRRGRSLTRPLRGRKSGKPTKPRFSPLRFLCLPLAAVLR